MGHRNSFQINRMVFMHSKQMTCRRRSRRKCKYTVTVALNIDYGFSDKAIDLRSC